MPTITGTPGDDNLKSTEGTSDVLVGLAGNDTYTVNDPGDSVVEAAGEGFDIVYYTRSTFNTDAFQLGDNQYVEMLIGQNFAYELDGGNLDDTIFGTFNSSNILRGNGGNDALYGLGFGDQLWGGDGNDYLDPGDGNAQMHGGPGDDRYVYRPGLEHLYEAPNEGYDTIYFTYGTVDFGASNESFEFFWFVNMADTSSSHVAGSLGNGATFLGNNGANTFDGGGGDNIIYGYGGNDTLTGQGFNDYLDGGTGADRMTGRAGNDVYVVDDSGDVVNEAAGQGFDLVYALASYVLTAGSEVEVMQAGGLNPTAAINMTGNELDNDLWDNAGGNTLSGAGGKDALFGFDGNDTLFGGSDRDLLDGGNGNDRLDGGADADVLLGEGGADVFAFTTALGGGNVDTIGDFASAQGDSFSLDHNVFAGIATGTLSASAFHAGASADDAAQRIIYNSATGELFYDADGSGAGAAVLFATVIAGTALAATDFIIA